MKHRFEILDIEGHDDSPFSGSSFKDFDIRQRAQLGVSVKREDIVSYPRQWPADGDTRHVMVQQQLERQGLVHVHVADLDERVEPAALL